MNLKTPTLSNLRRAVQLGFSLLCIWIGVEFFFFVRFLDSNGYGAPAARPPGAEAFLPISSMMSLRYSAFGGGVHPYHPAGLFIFIAILLMSFFFGKSFCGWVCPFGFVSELITKATQRTPLAKLRIPKWLDYPLRGLKYILLAFFAWATFVSSLENLRVFLDSDYNMMADVKMYHFFANLSPLAITILAILIGLTVVIPRFWCRYLCPYGGLLGILSLISPNKIKRDPASCIDCGLCTQACPSRIKVDTVKTVISDECLTCMECISACPVKGTLQVQTVGIKQPVPKWIAAFSLLIIFFSVLTTAQVMGRWHNEVPIIKYLFLYQRLDRLGHPRSPGDMQKLSKPPSVTDTH